MPNAKIYSDCSSELLVDTIADLESALYGGINNNINGLFTFSYRHWKVTLCTGPWRPLKTYPLKPY